MMKVLNGILSLFILLLSACGPQEENTEPETACYFQQNKYNQRVSWSRLPVRLHAESSLSLDQVEALKTAIEIWNQKFKSEMNGKTAFVFAGTISGTELLMNDGINLVSLAKTWERDPSEQAETVLHWSKTVIQDADVRINGLKPLSNSAIVNSDELDIVALLVHELGHVLGLGEIQVDAYSAMSPYLGVGAQNNRRTIGAVEVDALRCEY